MNTLHRNNPDKLKQDIDKEIKETTDTICTLVESWLDLTHPEQVGLIEQLWILVNIKEKVTNIVYYINM